MKAAKLIDLSLGFVRRYHKRIKKRTKLIISVRVFLTLAHRDEYRRKWGKKEVYIEILERSKVCSVYCDKRRLREKPCIIVRTRILFKISR